MKISRALPRLLTLATALAFGPMLLSGCKERELASLIGKNCTVQFKRNSLGEGSSLPTSPTSNSVNGAQVSMSGKLESVSEHWIMLSDAGNSEIWIPQSEVLLIQVSKQ